MRRTSLQLVLVIALTCFLQLACSAQEHKSLPVFEKSTRVASSAGGPELSPLENAATEPQIREYLDLSGDADSFRERWVAAVDKNRSIGAPYWPEAFWTDLKAEMQKTDLVPMYVNLFQHGISRDLMQKVLDAYHRLGKEHFRGSPECFKLGDAELALAGDMDTLKLAKTQEVAEKVYDIYRPQIKAARVAYMAAHPEWKDK